MNHKWIDVSCSYESCQDQNTRLTKRRPDRFGNHGDDNENDGKGDGSRYLQWIDSGNLEVYIGRALRAPSPLVCCECCATNNVPNAGARAQAKRRSKKAIITPRRKYMTAVAATIPAPRSERTTLASRCRFARTTVVAVEIGSTQLLHLVDVPVTIVK